MNLDKQVDIRQTVRFRHCLMTHHLQSSGVTVGVATESTSCMYDNSGKYNYCRVGSTWYMDNLEKTIFGLVVKVPARYMCRMVPSGGVQGQVLLSLHHHNNNHHNSQDCRLD